MALAWTNKINNIDDIDAGDVNSLAAAIIENENSIADKADKADTYTKSEIDSKITGVYKFKGSKGQFAQLPSIWTCSNGDVYNVIEQSKVAMYIRTLVQFDWYGGGMEGETINIQLSSSQGLIKGNYYGIYDGVAQHIGYIKMGDIGINNWVSFLISETDNETVDTLLRLGIFAEGSDILNQDFYIYSFNGNTLTGTSELMQICRAGENLACIKDTNNTGYWDVLGGTIDMSGYYTIEQVNAAIAAAIAAHLGV